MTLVAAIIPAFNAERTIDATLRSVRGQTHQELEIIVVDDGSTDETSSVVQYHAATDPRVRLVSQANGGVAAARNRGIAESKAAYIAPVDADDVWHPEKIARQLDHMQNDPQVALVCTAYSVIDEAGDVTIEWGGSMPRTNQFSDLCRRNFIGNGSSSLIRRAVLDQIGGYDESLRAQGAQGCEDLKLYLQIAERHPLAMIRLPLTGYRQLPDNMSSDWRQMLRSFDIVAGQFCSKRPELRRKFQAHRTYMVSWLASRALTAKRWDIVGRLLGELARKPSLALADAVSSALIKKITRTLPPPKRSRRSEGFGLSEYGSGPLQRVKPL